MSFDLTLEITEIPWFRIDFQDLSFQGENKNETKSRARQASLNI